MKLTDLKQIETPRLIIRPVQLGDEVAINQAIRRSLDILQRWMPWAKDPSLETTKKFIQDAVAARESDHFNDFPVIAINKTTKQFILAAGFNHFSEFHIGTYEIGYWIDAQYSGQGYVTEFVNALTYFVFEYLKGIRVQIATHVENEKSIAVAKRCGYEYEATLKHNRIDCVSGKPADSFLFAMIDAAKIPELEITVTHTPDVSYQKIASWYDEHRSRDLFEKRWLDNAIGYLKPNAVILDMGCGMGEPIARYFLEKKFNLTGIDTCSEFIEMAKQRLPQGNFFVGDMRKLSLNKKFDLLIAWNSYFHLTCDEQRDMFRVFINHLNHNGILLFTSGPEEGEVWSDNGGEMIYHASLSPNEYKQLLKQHKLELLDYVINDKNCNDHTVWLAKYRG